MTSFRSTSIVLCCLLILSSSSAFHVITQSKKGLCSTGWTSSFSSSKSSQKQWKLNGERSVAYYEKPKVRHSGEQRGTGNTESKKKKNEKRVEVNEIYSLIESRYRDLKARRKVKIVFVPRYQLTMDKSSNS